MRTTDAQRFALPIRIIVAEMTAVVAPAAGNNPERAASFGTTGASAKTDVEASARAANAVLVVLVVAAAAVAFAGLAAVAAVAVEFVDFERADSVTGNLAVLVGASEVVQQRLAPLLGSLLLLLRSYGMVWYLLIQIDIYIFVFICT